MRIISAFILCLFLAGCGITAKEAYKENYTSYATACAQIGTPKIASVNGVTIYSQLGCGLKPPTPPREHNFLGWGGLLVKAALGFKLFDEGLAVGVGDGISALSNNQVGGNGFIGGGPGFIDQTHPPVIVEPFIVNTP